jgi:CO/xanthine dehydrogenase Mo-binding subunit
MSSKRSRPRPAARPLPSVGRSIPKLEAWDKVTGAALYVDDLAVPGVLHGRTVRSTLPRARILSVTLDAGFDWSEFVVVDHRDIPGENVVALIEDDQPVLAAGETRHAEEPVLLLAHEDAERAEEAVRHARIEEEPLPAVLTVDQALAGTPRIHGDDNVLKRLLIERGEVEAAMARADRVFEGEYRVPHQEQLYIENNGMVAHFEPDGTLVVRGSLQCPYYVHKALKRVFALSDSQVRVVQTVTGGGFGGKEEYPSMIAAHAALLARKAGRPVKLIYDRLEDIAATTKRHPGVIRHRTGVMRDGTLVAQDIEVVLDGGAYVTLSPVVLSRGALHAAGPYRCENVRIRAVAVATNTPPNGAFRGFGAPQTHFAGECHMNRIARELGLDPETLRLRNVVREGDVTPTGQVLRESVGAEAVLEDAVEAGDFCARRRAAHAHNRRAEAEETRLAARGRRPARRLRRGVGLSLVHHGSGFTGSGEVKLASRAAVDLAPDGRPRILSASTEIGQGTITMFAQLVGETLGVAPEQVVVEQPDTALVPDSGPTVASRTCMVVGGLLQHAAVGVRERLELFAERQLRGEADFRATARRFLHQRGPLRVEARYEKPPEIHWDDDTYRGDAYGVFSYACTIVEVEVDLDTWETRVVDALASCDIGTVVHPALAAGQVEGGVVQALGYALLEDVRWKDGRVWNHQLTNYIIPTTEDCPPIRVRFVPRPYSRGPFGAKGVGELPMDGPAPAVVAAIAQATGVHVPEIPVTPERLRASWQRERK